MNPPSSDATQRFSDRVDDYVRWRPRYPAAVWQTIAAQTGLQPGCVVADIGSGTGISSDLLLTQGCRVIGVEPNAAMRAAAERHLERPADFQSCNGTAEATGLPDESVDAVLAAQSFHWFNHQASRTEFQRILRRPGWTILLWHTRRLDSTPFLRDYEQLLEEFGTDYKAVRHTNVDEACLQAFFIHGFSAHVLEYRQQFDREGLRGRLMSSSYAPAAGHPQHVPMIAALNRLFDQHQRDGFVVFEYDTHLYVGQLRVEG